MPTVHSTCDTIGIDGDNQNDDALALTIITRQQQDKSDEDLENENYTFCHELVLDVISHVDSFASNVHSHSSFSFASSVTVASNTTVVTTVTTTVVCTKENDDENDEKCVYLKQQGVTKDNCFTKVEQENVENAINENADGENEENDGCSTPCSTSSSSGMSDIYSPFTSNNSLLVYHSPLTPNHDYLKHVFDSVFDGSSRSNGVNGVYGGETRSRIVLLKECILQKVVKCYYSANGQAKDLLLSELSNSASQMTHIYQVKVVRQRTSAVCGYHALFNAIQALRAFDHHWSTNEELNFSNVLNDGGDSTRRSDVLYDNRELKLLQNNDSLCPLDHMFNRTSFWFFFIRMQRLLKMHALSKPKQHYPWCTKNIELGLFEREYMKFVIDEESEQIPKIGRHRFTSIPDLSVRSLRNAILTSSQVVSVQRIFDRFQQAKNGSNMNHAFCLGSGNHWFAFVVHQHRTLDGETSIEGLYLDSRNNRLFGQSDEQLEQQVLRRLRKAELRTKYSDSEREYYLYNYLESLKDTQYSIDLILGCIRGERNFISECLTVAIRAMLDTFHTEVNTPLATTSIDNKLMLPWILLWVQNYYPASYIYGAIVQLVLDLGASYLSESLRQEVLGWIRVILRETSDECIHALKSSSSLGYNIGVSDIDRLVKVIHSLERAITR